MNQIQMPPHKTIMLISNKTPDQNRGRHKTERIKNLSKLPKIKNL